MITKTKTTIPTTAPIIEWKNFPVPEGTISIAVLDVHIYAATNDKLYQTGYINTTSDLNWTEIPTPVDGYITNIQVNADVLYLLKNKTIFKYRNSKWETDLKQADIENFMTSPDYYEGLIAWNSTYVFLKRNNIWSKKSFPDITTAAVDLNNVFLFTSNSDIYAGRNLTDLYKLQNLEDLNFKEACYSYTGKHYTVVGSTSSFASYYNTDNGQTFKYTHILTDGVLNTCAAINRDIWIGGVLNDSNGVIFNSRNMAEIYYFNSSIFQLRTNKLMNRLVALHYDNSISIRNF